MPTDPNPAWVTLRMTNRINRADKPLPRDPIPVTIRCNLEPRVHGGPTARVEYVDGLAVGWADSDVYVEVESEFVYLPAIWVAAEDVTRRGAKSDG